MLKTYKKYKKLKKYKPVAKQKWFAISISVFVLCILGFYTFFVNSYFNIKEIKITGAANIDPGAIKDATWQVLNGKQVMASASNIFALPKNQIKKEILGKFLNVKDVAINKQLPNQIEIVIKERDEMALWCNQKPDENAYKGTTSSPDTSNCFAIDDNGIIFENKSAIAPDFVINSQKEGAKSGDKVLEKEDLSVIKEIKEKTQSQAGIKIVACDMISKTQYNFKTEPGWYLFFNPKKDIELQTVSLNLVLKTKLPESKRGSLKYIDLRFETIATYPEIPKDQEK